MKKIKIVFTALTLTAAIWGLNSCKKELEQKPIMSESTTSQNNPSSAFLGCVRKDVTSLASLVPELNAVANNVGCNYYGACAVKGIPTTTIITYNVPLSSCLPADFGLPPYHTFTVAEQNTILSAVAPFNAINPCAPGKTQCAYKWEFSAVACPGGSPKWASLQVKIYYKCWS